ncbi:monofunctional biosynthetic peptidoglycan transglycosylase [Flavobacteriaceae bacterium Ap0902]|nr:monofunctional biosynthetic peptidoglycan transglycosylase [Flavobacteriaceae bacterium Ap0902]
MIRKLFKFIFLLLAFPWVYALLLHVINPPITITQITSIVEGYGLNRDYLASDEMPEDAYWALVGAEDQKFAIHNGFDLDGIKKAYEVNKQGKKLRGGSTISQQVAKNVFLWQGRTWIRKGLEAYCTLVIETVLPKKRILALYLNISEMGKGTFGLGAAAEYYFKKPATQLSRNEIARIIAALPSPKKYRINPPSDYISKRATWIERQIRNLKGDPALSKIIKESP